jgi:hypothetical protein
MSAEQIEIICVTVVITSSKSEGLRYDVITLVIYSKTLVENR